MQTAAKLGQKQQNLKKETVTNASLAAAVLLLVSDVFLKKKKLKE